MGTKTAVKKEGLPIIHCIITVALMIVIGLLPPVGPITSYGMQVIGVLVGVVYGMSMVDVYFPSLCAIIILALASGSFSTSVVSMLGSTTVWGMIMVCIVLYAMQAERVTDFFANWIINRKIIRGRPWLFSFAILVGDSLLSIISPEAAMLLFWEIIFAVCDAVKIDRKDPWSVSMIFGTCFASGVGIIYLPFMRNGLVVNNQFTAMSGGQIIDPLKYILGIVPLGICGIVIFILLCKFVFKPDITPFKAIDVTIADQSALKLGRRQVIVMLAMLVLLLILFAPYLLPAEWGLTAFMSNLGLFGACAVIILALALIKVDGAPLLNIQEAASKNIQWGTVFMVALLMPLGNAISGADSGIMTTLTSVLSPVLQGKSVFIFSLIIIVIGVILTNVSQNLVVIGILMPIVGAMAGEGVNLAAMTVLIALATHYAVLLPSASFVTGIMFSNDNVTNGFLYKYGAVICVVCGVFAATVGYLWCNLIF